MFTLNNYPIEYIIICPAGDMRILLYLNQFQLTTNKKETLKRKLLLKSYKKEDCYLLVRQGIDSSNDSFAHFLSESAKKVLSNHGTRQEPILPTHLHLRRDAPFLWIQSIKRRFITNSTFKERRGWA